MRKVLPRGPKGGLARQQTVWPGGLTMETNNYLWWRNGDATSMNAISCHNMAVCLVLLPYAAAAGTCLLAAKVLHHRDFNLQHCRARPCYLLHLNSSLHNDSPLFYSLLTCTLRAFFSLHYSCSRRGCRRRLRLRACANDGICSLTCSVGRWQAFARHTTARVRGRWGGRDAITAGTPCLNSPSSHRDAAIKHRAYQRLGGPAII